MNRSVPGINSLVVFTPPASRVKHTAGCHYSVSLKQLARRHIGARISASLTFVQIHSLTHYTETVVRWYRLGSQWTGQRQLEGVAAPRDAERPDGSATFSLHVKKKTSPPPLHVGI